MIVQRCLKEIHGITLDEAENMLSGGGIRCNWWRNVKTIDPWKRQNKLTDNALDLHVNRYNPVENDTPFISLSAGCVSRDQFHQTNIVLPARATAVEFATDGGAGEGYIMNRVLD